MVEEEVAEATADRDLVMVDLQSQRDCKLESLRRLLEDLGCIEVEEVSSNYSIAALASK